MFRWRYETNLRYYSTAVKKNIYIFVNNLCDKSSFCASKPSPGGRWPAGPDEGKTETYVSAGLKQQQSSEITARIPHQSQQPVPKGRLLCQLPPGGSLESLPRQCAKRLFFPKHKTGEPCSPVCYYLAKNSSICAFFAAIRPCWQLGLPPPRPFKTLVISLPSWRRSPFLATRQKA